MRALARIVALLSLVITALVATAGQQPVAAVQHTQLVPEVAASGYPEILKTPARPIREGGNREVFGTDLVGRNIVSGGDFLHIELTDGTVVDQQYFAAWNIDTKQPVCFDQLEFDNEVMAIEPGPTPTEVYVGGRFLNVTGSDGVKLFRSRVALINLADCSVDRSFVVTGATAKVDEIVYTGDRLFVGGDFIAIGGVDQRVLAELDPVTGIVNADFDLDFTSQRVSPVSGMAVNPDETRLIVGGRFGTVDDQFGTRIANSATMIIDITGDVPVLTQHRWTPPLEIRKLQDISVSPDATVIGAAFALGTTNDYAYLIEANETSVTERWGKFTRDSNFGIGVTNNAVYVGGHFCYIQGGPGESEEMTPKLGFDSCTGSRAFNNGVWRTQLAALSLEDGTPLTWNPGSNAFRGISEITPIDRGLLIGHDGDFAGDRRTGALVFLDFGPDDSDTTPPSTVAFTAPTEGASIGNPVLISGEATDDVVVTEFRIAVQADDGQWVQADGTLGATRYAFRTPADASGRFSTEISMPAGDFTVEARAADAAGNLSSTLARRAFTQNGTEFIAPEATIDVPTRPVPLDIAIEVGGTATDNSEIASLAVQVETSDGRWVQPDGSLAASPATLPYDVTDGGIGQPTLTWTTDLGTQLPNDVYTVTVMTADASGNATTATATFEVSAEAVEATRVIADFVQTRDQRLGGLALGYSFTVAEESTALALAVSDTDGDGVLTNPGPTPVAIYRYSSRELLAETQIPEGEVAEDGFVWADLAEPLTLEAGVEYVVVQLTKSNGEPFVDRAEATLSTDDTRGFSVVRAMWRSSAQMRFPTNERATTLGTLHFGLPNLEIGPPLGVQNQAPTVEPIAAQEIFVGDAMVPLQVVASDPEAGPLTFDATQLPDGISIDGAGVISGVPTTRGTVSSTIIVTDDVGQVARTTIDWTVTEEGFEPPPPCRVTERTGGMATIEWDPVEDQRNKYQVLVNGGWKAGISQDAELTWTGAAAVDATIVLRTRPNWVVTDITCVDTFDPPPPPPDPVDPTCTVTGREGDIATVVWTPVPDEPTDSNGAYQVRIDARWRKTVKADQELTWTGNAPEGSLIEIRSRQGDILTDVACT